jgi:hypothetical protein
MKAMVIKRQLFKKRLNDSLDSLELPPLGHERNRAFAIMFNLKIWESAAILNGHILPNPTLLNNIAAELDIDVSWLSGETDDKP